jgi:hypothetical protein
MKKLFTLFLIFSFSLLLFYPLVPAGAAEDFDVFIFTTSDCPHCQNVVNYFEIVSKEQYPEAIVNVFPFSEDGKYYSRFLELADAYKIKNDKAPVTFIGPFAIVGYQVDEIQDALAFCKSNTCKNPEEIAGVQEKDPAPGFSLIGKNKLIAWAIVIVALGIILFIAFFGRRLKRDN